MDKCFYTMMVYFSRLSFMVESFGDGVDIKFSFMIMCMKEYMIYIV